MGCLVRVTWNTIDKMNSQWGGEDIAMIYIKESSACVSNCFILHLGLYLIFTLFFVYSIRECSKFILLHVSVRFYLSHLLKRWSFLHYIFLPSLS